MNLDLAIAIGLDACLECLFEAGTNEMRVVLTFDGSFSWYHIIEYSSSGITEYDLHLFTHRWGGRVVRWCWVSYLSSVSLSLGNGPI